MPFSGSHKIVVNYQSVEYCALSLFSYSVLEISVIGVRMQGEGKIVPLHAVKARRRGSGGIIPHILKPRR